MLRSISGSLATTSQLSIVRLPVLTPPETNVPPPKRALTVMSMPFQCSVCVPYLSESVLRFNDCPNFAGVMLYNPLKASAPSTEP